MFKNNPNTTDKDLELFVEETPQNAFQDSGSRTPSAFCLLTDKLNTLTIDRASSILGNQEPNSNSKVEFNSTENSPVAFVGIINTQNLKPAIVTPSFLKEEFVTPEKDKSLDDSTIKKLNKNLYPDRSHSNSAPPRAILPKYSNLSIIVETSNQKDKIKTYSSNIALLKNISKEEMEERRHLLKTLTKQAKERPVSPRNSRSKTPGLFKFSKRHIRSSSCSLADDIKANYLALDALQRRGSYPKVYNEIQSKIFSVICGLNRKNSDNEQKASDEPKKARKRKYLIM